MTPLNLYSKGFPIDFANDPGPNLCLGMTKFKVNLHMITILFVPVSHPGVDRSFVPHSHKYKFCMNIWTISKDKEENFL